MVHRIALILFCFSLAVIAQTSRKTAPKPGPSPAAAVKGPEAVIHTTAGNMKCQLFPDQAPKAVANFVGLATGKKDWTNPATAKVEHGKPLYDGVIFHRTIPNFMIQGGDPTGTGSGDVGFKFDDELHADLLFDKPGRLAMANSGPNTNGSQFFITETQLPGLNPCLDPNGCGQRPPDSGYTIFGQCDDATVDMVKKIARMPCQGGQPCNPYNSRPANPVKITHIDIVNAPKGASNVKKPAAKSGVHKKSSTKQ